MDGSALIQEYLRQPGRGQIGTQRMGKGEKKNNNSTMRERSVCFSRKEKYERI